ncbi:MAG: DUF6621 family protein [Prevotella sp.]|nr:hypothetical protein [Bacteroidales bacterium]MDY4229371.1 DUF6621 family protein [Prevotella sp.]
MNPLQSNNIKWSENVIVADADYIDKVAFNLTVYFERALNRRIPKADFSTWAVDIALDGGLREGDHETQVVLVHDKKKRQLDYFAPSLFDSELNAQAFKHDRMGEFIINSVPVEPSVASNGQLMADLVRMFCDQKNVKRVMVVPDSEQGDGYEAVARTLRPEDDDEKRITLFAMQQMPTGNFRQEVLGYSLMNALGISADELK